MRKAMRGMVPGNAKKRAAYRERRRAQLQEWSAKVDLWQARARKTKAGVKVRYHEQLDELRDALDSMRSRLGELDEARAETWDELKAGVDEAADRAGEIVDRVSRRLER